MDMNRKLRGLALAALATAAVVTQAEASTVSVSPATQNTTVGGNASIDIFLNGLDASEAVGGFSMTVHFLNSIINGVIYFNDPDVKMGLAPLDMSLAFSGGTLDLFFTADASETFASLQTAQGTGFKLATVNFKGAADGVSPVTLSDVVLSNWDGSADLATPTTRNGSICVGARCDSNPTPEPASMLLVAAAIGGLVTTRRRRSA